MLDCDGVWDFACLGLRFFRRCGSRILRGFGGDSPGVAISGIRAPLRAVLANLLWDGGQRDMSQVTTVTAQRSYCVAQAQRGNLVALVNTHPEASGQGQHNRSGSVERPADRLESRQIHRSPTRRYARYRTELPLIVSVLGQDGYIRIHGRCFEIAEAGLGAVTTSELVPGELVSLEFSIPEGPEVLVRAAVRHRMGFLHGFEFISLQPEEREHIRAFCRKLGPG
jgi:hypothetical protein